MSIPFKTAAQVQADSDTLARNRQQQAELANIYEEYKWMVKSVATDKTLIEIVSRFLGVQPGEVLITLLDFKQAYWANQGAINEMFGYGLRADVATQRKDALESIAKLLSPESFHAERFRLSGMDLNALKARLKEIQLKQTLAPHSATEIKDALKIVRDTQGRPPLDPSWTREKLLASSSYCIKFLTQKHGTQAINDRLQNRG